MAISFFISFITCFLVKDTFAADPLLTGLEYTASGSDNCGDCDPGYAQWNHGSGAWCAASDTNGNLGNNLIVNLGDYYVLTKVNVKSPWNDEYVSQYTVRYSLLKNADYETLGSFPSEANGDEHEIHIPKAQYIRIYPTADEGWPCLQVAFYGHLWTDSPTQFPTLSPTNPTEVPTQTPTNQPTRFPTNSPTQFPTLSPTKSPTKFPTKSPTYQPTVSPTKQPTETPTNIPTLFTNVPSTAPTESPITLHPTLKPTKTPTENDGLNPTTTTEMYVSESRDNLTMQNEGEANGLLFLVLGIGIVAFVCLVSGICVFKKRSKNRRKEIYFGATDNEAGQPNKTQNIPKVERLASQSGDIMMTNMATNVNNINEGDFGSNLTNLTGVSNVLMDDIVDDMDDQNMLAGTVTTKGGPDSPESVETDENMMDDQDATPDTNPMHMIHTGGNDGDFNVEEDMIIEADDVGGYTPNIGDNNSENYANLNGEGATENNGVYEDLDDIENVNEDDDDEMVMDNINNVTAGGPMENNNEDLDDIENEDETDEMVMNDIDHVTAGGPIQNNNDNIDETDDMILNDINDQATAGEINDEYDL